MGIDYIVDLPCGVKSDLTLPTLVGLVKDQNQALAVLDAARESGDHAPPEAIRFRRVAQRPEGTTSEDVTVQAVLQHTSRLDPYQPYCQACPANALREPFGCYGSLPYPIPAEVEQWLLDRLPATLDGTAGRLLRAAMQDFGYDGGVIKDMRRHRMFFAAPSPLQRAWRIGLTRWKISTDQLLQVMIGLGTLEPAHCAMLALFLGVVPHTVPQEVWRVAETRRRALAEADIETSTGEPDIQRWAHFLRALALAAALDVRLLIDT